MTRNPAPKLRLALIGASTLIGREIKSVLAEKKIPVNDLVLMDRDDDLGRLTEFDGDPMVSSAIVEAGFDSLDGAFFLVEPEMARKFSPLAAEKGFWLLDLSHAFLELQQVPLYSGAGGDASGLAASNSRLLSLPHAAATVLMRLIGQLAESVRLVRCAVTILEPASERDRAGVEELENQTRNIFSFQPLPRAVFDQQIAFNLLAAFGTEAKEKLSLTEKIISKQLERLLAGRCVPVSLNLLQAPVFHGHSFSLYFETGVPLEISRIEEIWKTGEIEVIESAEEPPNPVQTAGTDRILVGGIKKDLVQPCGYWAWAVADHLRIAAINAVTAMQEILISNHAS